MKYFGIFLLIIAASSFAREYTVYMKRRLSQCRDFLSFISHMRICVGCYLLPSDELWRGFESDELSAVGFLDSVKSGDGIFSAYKKCEGNLSLSREEKSVLSELFSSLGEGYLEDGMHLIRASEERMQELYRALYEDFPRCVKLAATLSLTAAIGISILII